MIDYGLNSAFRKAIMQRHKSETTLALHAPEG
ncbi:MAG: hypothetical protein ACI861_000119 [Paracoccaceae bacterium]|jgi:hypothetical protein